MHDFVGVKVLQPTKQLLSVLSRHLFLESLKLIQEGTNRPSWNVLQYDIHSRLCAIDLRVNVSHDVLM
jgi:hypothetical protein